VPKKTKRQSKSRKIVRLYRYSDVNTYTDNLTLAQAQDFQRKQNGGTITPMSEARELDPIARAGIKPLTPDARDARAGLIPESDWIEREDKHSCSDCGRTFTEDQLGETHNIWERVSPGEIMPSGECPKCGALCHPMREPATVKLTVIGGVAEAYEVPKGIRVEVHDYDCDAIADAPDIHRDKNGDRYILKVWE
jgi:hypothetical protein